jgi:hypothetical protein
MIQGKIQGHLLPLLVYEGKLKLPAAVTGKQDKIKTISYCCYMRERNEDRINTQMGQKRNMREKMEEA